VRRKYPGVKELAKLTKRGRYAVGPNLYMQISEWGTKAWIFRYRIGGRCRHMGLGPYDLLSLAEARERGYAARRQLKIDGVDPLEVKRQRRLATPSKTFKQCTLECIAANEDGWRGGSSRVQWLAEFERNVFPKIGDMPIAAVDIAAVLGVLDPILKIPTVAARTKNRIAQVLDWAAARELRSHDNPAKRANLLPKRRRRPSHFAALPYVDIPLFVAELRRSPEMAARALEFMILTAARPSEATGARWSEIDGQTWTVPGARMKGGRKHRVPLSEPAVELLINLPREGDFVFPGRFADTQVDKSGPGRLLKRMGKHITAHGFRSTFRDWAAETTNTPNHVVEQALAHAIGNAVEASYRRGDLFEKRRRLMAEWAKYCGGQDGH